ncbi:MAG: hypothetical protein EHM49_01590 [Deltaproteobacteria bacterium]|nr:MAG: hypothetical protein EHM49_01590 [Deltaproteobacteria bacterium]
MDISLLKRLALATDHRRFDAAGPGAEALMVTAALFQGAVDKEPQDGLGTVFRVCASLATGQKPISINGVAFRTSF